MRIGHGYDVHRLVPGRKLILGGVEIPYALGLDGHSDADVLLHAVMDALLGAAGLGDIGRLFPDTDEKYLGISSLVLLENVAARLEQAGYRLGNLDVTMIAQKPKLKDFVPEMVENIARTLHTEASRVNVKATTEEHLGFTGDGQRHGLPRRMSVGGNLTLCGENFPSRRIFFQRSSRFFHRISRSGSIFRLDRAEAMCYNLVTLYFGAGYI